MEPGLKLKKVKLQIYYLICGETPEVSIQIANIVTSLGSIAIIFGDNAAEIFNIAVIFAVLLFDQKTSFPLSFARKARRLV
jgi:hypothetical protein